MRYPREVHEFIAENVKGTTTKDLAEMVNNKFGTQFTPESMKSYKGNHKLKSGTPVGIPKGTPSKEFPAEIGEFMRQNCQGITANDMAKLLNERFGKNYTYNQIKAYYTNHGLKNGVDCKFRKGNVPPNKGKKGVWNPGCEKSWFKPGHVSLTRANVGEERYRPKDGYVWIKVEEPNKWRMKHLFVWEKAYGKIPKGKCLIFLDGDRMNTDLSNLMLVDRGVNLILNRRGLRSENPDYTEAGVNVAKLISRTHKLKKKGDRHEKK